MSIPLLTLAIAAFGFGMTEFMVVGMLPMLSESFSVSTASAGLLVTAYALAVTAAAPLVTAFTMKVKRKKLILGVILLFILGNMLGALTSSYPMLVIARLLSGMAHGVFFAVSLKVVVQLVEKERQASAIALMLSGLTLALVLGVPFGTFLAENFSWRISFWIVAAISVIAFLGIFKWFPDLPMKFIHVSMWRQFSFLAHKSMIYSYALTILTFGGPFIVYTYVSNILHSVTGFSFNSVSLLLVLYGASVAVGNLMGGRFCDRFGVFRTIKINIFLLTLILAGFYFAQFSLLYSVFTLALWGAISFSIVPSLQFLIMKLISHYKVQSEEVASGTNVAAFNLGIAGGSYFGGVIVDTFSLTLTSLGAAIVVALSYFLIHAISKNHECEVSVERKTDD